MGSTPRLDKLKKLDQLKQDYPQFKFIKGDHYMWSSQKRTIYYRLPIDLRLILHELSHGLLNHSTYILDIDLLKKEVDAWEKAKQLAKDYNIRIQPKLIKNKLETYRNWLDKRSRCPNCHLIGVQKRYNQNYSCINCHRKWSVPDDPQVPIKLSLI